MSSSFHLRMHYLYPIRRCPQNNLLVMGIMLPVSCLTGRNHERSQLQRCQSSFESHTLLGCWELSQLSSPQFHTTYVDVLCTKSMFTIVLCNEINESKFVSAHKYFKQIVHAINRSSSLSMWCQDSIVQCKHFVIILCLHSHDLQTMCEYL